MPADCDVALLMPNLTRIAGREVQSVMARLAARTRRVMYVQGHADDTWASLFSQLRMFTDFPCIEYRGAVIDADGGEAGPLFRCSREVLNQRAAAARLAAIVRNETYKRVAVVGKAGAGKSYIRKLVQHMINFEHDYTFLDDNADYEHVNRLERLLFFWESE